MIEIKRESCPKILYNFPTEGKLYNKPAVVKKLWDMQHGKCCYCESEIPKDGHGKEVEHYYPQAQSLYPHFRNDWNNLLLVCHSCNGKKSHKFPLDENGNPLLIDPSTLAQTLNSILILRSIKITHGLVKSRRKETQNGVK